MSMLVRRTFSRSPFTLPCESAYVRGAQSPRCVRPGGDCALRARGRLLRPRNDRGAEQGVDPPADLECVGRSSRPRTFRPLGVAYARAHARRVTARPAAIRHGLFRQRDELVSRLRQLLPRSSVPRVHSRVRPAASRRITGLDDGPGSAGRSRATPGWSSRSAGLGSWAARRPNRSLTASQPRTRGCVGGQRLYARTRRGGRRCHDGVGIQPRLPSRHLRQPRRRSAGRGGDDSGVRGRRDTARFRLPEEIAPRQLDHVQSAVAGGFSLALVIAAILNALAAVALWRIHRQAGPCGRDQPVQTLNARVGWIEAQLALKEPSDQCPEAVAR